MIRLEMLNKKHQLLICFACKSAYLVNDFSTANCLHFRSKYAYYDHWNSKFSMRNCKSFLVFWRGRMCFHGNYDIKEHHPRFKGSHCVIMLITFL